MDEEGKMGVAVFPAKQVGDNERNAKLNPRALREPNRRSFCNIILFQYDLPPKMFRNICN